MSCGIYIIKCTGNGKVYVGQSVSLEDRKRRHFRELRANKHANTHLQNSFNKYGEISFEFLVVENTNIQELNSREMFWIRKLNSTNRDTGFNICGGGDSLHTLPEEVLEKLRGRKMSPEAIAKMKGRVVSQETRKKLSDLRKNLSAEARARLSEAKRNISEETRLKMSNARKAYYASDRSKGYVVSDETKEKLAAARARRTPEERAKIAEKISLSHKGKKRSPEARKRMSGRKHTPEARLKMTNALKASWARRKAAQAQQL